MRFLENRQINFTTIDALCEKIVEKISDHPFDYVVGVETGGWYPGMMIAQLLGVPQLLITVRRIRGFQKFYRYFPSPLHLLPLVCSEILFLMSTPQLITKLDSEVEVLIQNKSVLIVDDAIHTGRTMAVAKQYLSSLGAIVKTAVLSNVKGRAVDYYCLDGVFFYPWSTLSSEHEKFLQVIAERCRV